LALSPSPAENLLANRPTRSNPIKVVKSIQSVPKKTKVVQDENEEPLEPSALSAEAKVGKVTPRRPSKSRKSDKPARKKSATARKTPRHRTKKFVSALTSFPSAGVDLVYSATPVRIGSTPNDSSSPNRRRGSVCAAAAVCDGRSNSDKVRRLLRLRSAQAPSAATVIEASPAPERIPWPFPEAELEAVFGFRGSVHLTAQTSGQRFAHETQERHLIINN